jgi:hypothetical protein
VIVIGLDPGTNESAIVAFNGVSVIDHRILNNALMLDTLESDSLKSQIDRVVLVVEEFESFGMAVGKEVFRTIRWAGNFEQAWRPRQSVFVPRKVVKSHLCHSTRATDANIRQALIDRFGPTPDRAIGKRKAPGPLFGIKAHEWSALALAVTWFDEHGHELQEVRPGVTPEF